MDNDTSQNDIVKLNDSLLAITSELEINQNETEEIKKIILFQHKRNLN